MDVVAGALALQYPDSNTNFATTSLQPELKRVTGPGETAMWVLSGAVALVLLIACANVASLLLARSTERAREFALRMALGASRPALVRSLLIESLALGVLGTAGGVLLAMGGLQAILPLAGDRIPRLAETSIDVRVLVFSAVLAVLTSVLFGLAPAIQAAAADPAGGLKEGARNIAPGHDRFRSALVIGQIALGLVLLVGAELLMASFLHLVRRDPGFRTDHLLTFDIGLSEAHNTVARQITFCDRLLERMAAIPGVQVAATGTPLPLQGHEMRVAFDIEERRTAASDRPRSDMAIVTPGYFTAMGIPLVKGRDFSERDAAGGPPVLVVNQAFARKVLSRRGRDRQAHAAGSRKAADGHARNRRGRRRREAGGAGDRGRPDLTTSRTSSFRGASARSCCGRRSRRWRLNRPCARRWQIWTSRCRCASFEPAKRSRPRCLRRHDS